ncbi:MAG: hypothetical protein QE271_05305 [Bacteriovoracaceae bacterium]|nr:hypothetical protein [Bacteriovoracaceae bacterium]
MLREIRYLKSFFFFSRILSFGFLFLGHQSIAGVEIECRIIGIVPNDNPDRDILYGCKIECVHKKSNGEKFKQYSGYVDCNQLTKIDGLPLTGNNNFNQIDAKILKQNTFNNKFPELLVEVNKDARMYPTTNSMYSSRVVNGKRTLSQGCDIIKFHWYQYLPDEKIVILNKKYNDSKIASPRFMHQRGDCDLSKEQLECVKKSYDVVNYCFYEFTCDELVKVYNQQTGKYVGNEGNPDKHIEAYCRCSDYKPGKEMHPLECLNEIKYTQKGPTSEQAIIYYTNTKKYIDSSKTIEFKDEEPSKGKNIIQKIKSSIK